MKITCWHPDLRIMRNFKKTHFLNIEWVKRFNIVSSRLILRKFISTGSLRNLFHFKYIVVFCLYRII